MSTTLLTILSVAAVSAISFVGIILFLFDGRMLKKILLLLVSFSAGALLGDVFLHIIPELSNKNILEQSLLTILAGVVISFVIEKIIHWRHCHNIDCEDHTSAVGTMNLIGDGAHNLIDGALIAGSFLVSIPVGIATSVAVALHEIPQEIGDFAILLHSGFSKPKALFFNFLSALSAFVGAALVLVSSSAMPVIGHYLLPLAAGNFLYIAGADLIPELHKETRLVQAFIQLIAMVAGIAVMHLLALLEL